jgi:hypothetical protein
VKFAVGAAVVDAIVGFSTPAFVVAHLAFAAGLLHGLESFRQLLRAMSAFGLVISVFRSTEHGASYVDLLGIGMGLAVVGVLGASDVREWCEVDRARLE